MGNKDPAFPVQHFFFLLKPDGVDFNFIVEVVMSFCKSLYY